MHFLNIEPIQKRSRKVGSVVFLAIFALFLFLYNWVVEAIAQAHISPKIEKQNIQFLLNQPQLTSNQLTTLSLQTGLHPRIVEEYLSKGRQQELLQIQQLYFEPIHIQSFNTTPFTISEYLVDEQGDRTIGMPLVDLQDGDVLITKNSRFLGWRNGHAALVVDADKGLILEAFMLGTVTKLSLVEKWSTYPSFQVLRLKEEYALEDEYTRNKNGVIEPLPQKVATYAEKNLIEIPYHLLAGISERDHRTDLTKVQAAEQEEITDAIPTGTHCAHLVWYAYMQFGIDLDSDGGWIVTPEDIRNSPYLEVIQSYGY